MSVLRNISWTATSQLLRMGLQFSVSVVLARLLTPGEFGLVGLTTIFVGFATVFADLGLGAAVVQRKDLTEAHISFVFWMNAAAGAALTLLLAASTPLIVRFYGEPRLRGITLTLACGFVVSGFGVLPGALLQRALAFRRLALVEIGSAAISGMLGIGLAFAGAGVYSLVAMSLTGQALNTGLRWMALESRPRIRWQVSGGRELLSYGAGLLGFNSINYWVRNGDNLLIGKVCGAGELGIYSLAYNLLLFPVYQVQGILGPVMFPHLASMQTSKREVRETYLRTCEAIAMLMFPLMAGLAMVADDFVHTLYGPKWVAAIPVIRVLAIAGLGNSVGTTVGWVYTAMGRTDLMFKWSLVAAPIMFLSFAAGVHWGALGVAIAYTCVLYVVLWYPMWRLAGGVIDLSFTEAMRAFSGPFAAAATMAAVVGLVRLMVGEHSMLRLILSILVGAGVYWMALQAFGVAAYVSMRNRVAVWMMAEQPVAQ